MQGRGVHCLVRALYARGYLLKTSTRQVHPPVGAAVAHFRRIVGLPRSRVAGWETLSRLGIYRPSCRIARPLGPGDAGPAVACLRRFLYGRGRPIPLAGGYGSQVAHAVRVIEARRGLPVDGVADVAFLRAIGAWRARR
jgi:peptidoglycan hydrolase-like protein with peptidoglycan-binding domain